MEAPQPARPSPLPYSKLYIYHTKAYLLVVGAHRGGGQYGLLRIVRHDGPKLLASEDSSTYTLAELNKLLRMTHANCTQQGGLQFVTKAYGLVGCIRFTASFYLLIVTKRTHVGTICGHKVHAVRDVSLLPLGAPLGVSHQKDSPVEKRYRKLLMGVDLTRNFYFSLSYNLAATLQHNHLAGSSRAMDDGHTVDGMSRRPSRATFAASAHSFADFDSMFVWNSYLTRSLREALGNSRWVVALVHGAFDQRRLSVLGRPLVLTLLARRSRYFAGTRFKKRGLSDQGNVANEVEVEQILDAGYHHGTGLPFISSIVQLRGSIPLYWSQQPTPLSPKPDFILQHFDPLYQATALHFAGLRERYGSPCICLNLLKSRERRPREMLLRREMALAIHLLNTKGGTSDFQSLVHIPWDFQKYARQAGAGLLDEISSITLLTLEATGLFAFNPSTAHMLHLLGQAHLAPPQHPKHAASVPATATATAASAAPPQPWTNGSAFARVQSGSVVGGWRPPESPHAAAGPGWPPGLAVQASSAMLERNSLAGSSHDLPPFRPPVVSSSGPGVCLLQQGVLRTNCIDCLDRTNVVQFAYGLVAFGLQLYLLGIAESPEIDSDSGIALVLMEQYELMGNTLALQYGGSDAHSLFFQRKKGLSETSSRSKDLLTSIQRFYSNTYTDAEKQDAINLILGNYIPGAGQPQLWELETDVYLHSAGDSVWRGGGDYGGDGGDGDGPGGGRGVGVGSDTEGWQPVGAAGSPAGHPSAASSSALRKHKSGGEGSVVPSSPTAQSHSLMMSRQQSSVAELALAPPAAAARHSITLSVPAAPPSVASNGAAAAASAAAHFPPPHILPPDTPTDVTSVADGGGPFWPRTPWSQPTHQIISSVSLLSLSSDDEEACKQLGTSAGDLGATTAPGGGGSGSGGAGGGGGGGGTSAPSPAPSADIDAFTFSTVRAATMAGLPIDTAALGQALDLSSSDTPWTFSSLWHSMFGASSRPSTALPTNSRPSLQLFDVVLGQPCRKATPVRLYSLIQRGNDQPPVMWQAVQSAFAFFRTPPDTDDITTPEASSYPQPPGSASTLASTNLPWPAGGYARTYSGNFSMTDPTQMASPSGFYPHPRLPLPRYLCAALLGRDDEGGGGGGRGDGQWHSSTLPSIAPGRNPRILSSGGQPDRPGATYASTLLRRAPNLAALAVLRRAAQIRKRWSQRGSSTSGSVFAAGLDAAPVVMGEASEPLAREQRSSRRAALSSLLRVGRQFNASLIQAPGGSSGGGAQQGMRRSVDVKSLQQQGGRHSHGGPALANRPSSVSQLSHAQPSQEVPLSAFALAGSGGPPLEAMPSGMSTPIGSRTVASTATAAAAAGRAPPWPATPFSGVAGAAAAALAAGRQQTETTSVYAHAGCLPCYWDMPPHALYVPAWDQAALNLGHPTDLGLEGAVRLWAWGMASGAADTALCPVDFILPHRSHIAAELSAAGVGGPYTPRYTSFRFTSLNGGGVTSPDSLLPLPGGAHSAPGAAGETPSPVNSTLGERVMGMLFKPSPNAPAVRLLASGSLWPRKSMTPARGTPVASTPTHPSRQVSTTKLALGFDQSELGPSIPFLGHRASLPSGGGDLQPSTPTRGAGGLVSLPASPPQPPRPPHGVSTLLMRRSARAGGSAGDMLLPIVPPPFGPPHLATTSPFASPTQPGGGAGSSGGGAFPYGSRPPLVMGKRLMVNTGGGTPPGLPRASMAAVGRVSVGIGPNSVAGSTRAVAGTPPIPSSRRASGDLGPLGERKPHSSFWQFVNPMNLVMAINHLAGGGPKPLPQPPIPVLNDFIEIGPQAQATLASRRAKAVGVTPRTSVSMGGAGGQLPLGLPLGSAALPRGLSSSHDLLLPHSSLMDGASSHVLCEVDGTGGAGGWLRLERRTTTLMGTEGGGLAPCEEDGPFGEFEAAVGLTWSSDLGGWLPAGGSMLGMLSSYCSVHDAGMPLHALVTWQPPNEQVQGLLDLHLGCHLVPGGQVSDLLASSATASSPLLPAWCTWASEPLPPIPAEPTPVLAPTAVA